MDHLAAIWKFYNFLLELILPRWKAGKAFRQTVIIIWFKAIK